MIACQSSPVPMSLPASVATARGEGRKMVEIQPYSVAALQSARNAQTEAI
jgi:predicted S18 family serine protease